MIPLVVLGVSLVAAVLLIALGIMLPTSIATLLSLGAVYWSFRREQIYSKTALGVCVLYLYVWFMSSAWGLDMAGLSPLELDAFFLFGVLGLAYIGFVGLIGRTVAAVRPSRNRSVIERVLSSLFGAVGVGLVAFRVRQIISIRTYAAIGVVPGILFNILFERLELGAIGELLADISAFATIGFLLGLAFVADSLHHVASGVGDFSGWGGNDSEPEPISKASLEQMSDQEFTVLVEVLVATAHDHQEWLSEDTNGYCFIYAESDGGGELIVGKRNGRIPQSATKFLEELEQNLDPAIGYLGQTPAQVSFVTNAPLNERLILHLEAKGLTVLDAAWFEKRLN